MVDPDPDSARDPENEVDEVETSESRVDAWVAPLFEESSLWPMLLVIVLVMITFGGSLLLLAYYERNFFAMAAVAGIVYLSLPPLHGAFVARRVGRGALLVAVLWGGSLAAAMILGWNDLF